MNESGDTAAMLFNILESLPDALVIVESNGNIFQVNSLAEAMFGYHRDEMLGEPVEILMPERYRQTHCQDRINYFKSPSVRPMNEHNDFYGLHKSGYQFPIEIHLSSLREGNEVWGLAAIRDIRTRKQMEDELRSAHDEMDQRVEERTETLAQINESLREEMMERKQMVEQMQQLTAELAHVSRLSILGEMTAGLAHELNQPLAAISNYSQGCVRRINKGGFDQESFVAVLERVTAEALRASEIISRFRLFARKEALQKQCVTMNKLIHNAVELERFEADAHGVDIQVKLQEPLPDVWVDEIQLQQVMVNLIRNAIEVTDALATTQQPIFVKAYREKDAEIVVAIADGGHGFSEQQAQQIFQPFFTTKSNGLGMGLSISRSIIEAHGGRLWAESSPGNGATFYFSLPVIEK